MTQRRRGRPRHPDILTPAEWRVLDELRAGGTNVEIAVRLGVSPDAVKFHISNMLAKLGLEDRQQLASWDRDPERGRLRALLAIPVALGSLARPLVWLGAGTAVLAGAAAIAVVLVVVSVSDDAVPVIPLATPTPISPTVGATSSPQPAPPSTVSPTPTPQETPTPAPTATPSPTTSATPYSHRWAGEEDPEVCCVMGGESDDPRFRSVLMCGISPTPVRPAHGFLLCNPLSGFLTIATAMPRLEEIRWIHPPPPEYEAAIAEFEARLQMPLLDSGVHTFSGEGYSFTITVPDDERVAVAEPSAGAYIFWTWRGRLRVSATAGGAAEIIEVIGDRDRVLFDELLNSVTWVERPGQSSSD